MIRSAAAISVSLSHGLRLRPCQSSRISRFQLSCFSASVSGEPKKSGKSWKQMLQDLRAHVEEHGHAYVPTHNSENPALGRWLDYQRQQYRLMKLGKPSNMTGKRIDQLEELGMVWEPRYYNWDQRYLQLFEYYTKHGHSLVPTEHESGLGQWLARQRQRYRARMEKGEHNFLTNEQIEKLNLVGMVWYVQEQTWKESYEELKHFYKEHGHTNIPSDPKNSLSNWVKTQRREFKRREEGQRSTMTKEREKKLNKLNFVWDTLDAQWMEKYEELKRFRAEYGHCLVPTRCNSNRALGSWVDDQRTAYRNRQKGNKDRFNITQERVDMLNAIDFAWNAYDARWQQKLDELKEFVRVNGFGRKPPVKTNTSLYLWLKRQEDQYLKMQEGEKVTMTEERAAKLQKLGFLIGQ